MKRVLCASLLIASASISVVSPARAKGGQVELAQNSDVDRLCNQFFETIKRGNGDAALEHLTAGSALWASKTTEKQALATQVKGAIQVYGQVRDFELVQSNAIGRLAIRRYYLVQHEKMVTRWELDFVHTGTGWMLGYFGFGDQVPTWF